MIHRHAAAAAVAVNAAALVVIATGWFQAAGEVRLVDQLPPLALAGAALLVAAATDAAVVVALRRAVRSRARRLSGWAVPSVPLPPVLVSAPADERGDATAGPSVTVAGGRLAHRTDCALTAGKPTRRASATADRCQVCRP